MTTYIKYIILLTFFAQCLGPLPAYAQAVLSPTGTILFPKPGVMVHLSPEYNPAVLKGIKVHPDNPFRFEFILDQGDGSVSSPNALIGDLKQDQLKADANRLIKYFLASVTVPEKDLWVNLSPYEKDRIVPDSFGKTEMGRDLLAQDYLLKQITASLIYPEDELGKKFWKRIYQEAKDKFNTTDIPVNTFNKVWIVPEKAVVYENTKAGTAYVVESRLKVMLEQDYLAVAKTQGQTGDMALDVSPSRLPSEEVMNGKATQVNNQTQNIASQIIREIVIPELTKEVNEGKNFAQLRQVYQSLILATWYKKKIKDSILSQVYADKNKIQGLLPTRGLVSPQAGDSPLVRDLSPSRAKPNDVEVIYQQYLQAFKKGVYNYIKEEHDPITQQPIPRKYFSGGFSMALNDAAMVLTSDTAKLSLNSDKAMQVSAELRQPLDFEDVNKVSPMLEKAIITSMFNSQRRLMDDFLKEFNAQAKIKFFWKEKPLSDWAENKAERHLKGNIIEINNQGVKTNWVIRSVFGGNYRKDKAKYEKLAYLLGKAIGVNVVPVRQLNQEKLNQLGLPNGVDDYYLTQVTADGYRFESNQTDLTKSQAGLFVLAFLLSKIDPFVFNKVVSDGVVGELDYSEILSDEEMFIPSLLKNHVLKVLSFLETDQDDEAAIDEMLLLGKNILDNMQKVSRKIQEYGLGEAILAADGLDKTSLLTAIKTVKGLSNLEVLIKEAGFDDEAVAEVLKRVKANQQQLGVRLDQYWELLTGENPNFTALDKAMVTVKKVEAEKQEQVIKEIHGSLNKGKKEYYQRLTEAVPDLRLSAFWDSATEANISAKLNKVFVDKIVVIQDDKGQETLWMLKNDKENATKFINDEVGLTSANERLTYLMSRLIGTNAAKVRSINQQEAESIGLGADYQDYYLMQIIDDEVGHGVLIEENTAKVYSSLFAMNMFLSKVDPFIFNDAFVDGVPDEIDSEDILRKDDSEYIHAVFGNHVLGTLSTLNSGPSSVVNIDMFIEWRNRFIQSMIPEERQRLMENYAFQIRSMGLGKALIAAEQWDINDIIEAVEKIKSINNIEQLVIDAGYPEDDRQRVIDELKLNQRILGARLDEYWELLAGEKAGFSALDQAMTTRKTVQRSVLKTQYTFNQHEDLVAEKDPFGNQTFKLFWSADGKKLKKVVYKALSGKEMIVEEDVDPTNRRNDLIPVDVKYQGRTVYRFYSKLGIQFIVQGIIPGGESVGEIFNKGVTDGYGLMLMNIMAKIAQDRGRYLVYDQSGEARAKLYYLLREVAQMPGIKSYTEFVKNLDIEFKPKPLDLIINPSGVVVAVDQQTKDPAAAFYDGNQYINSRRIEPSNKVFGTIEFFDDGKFGLLTVTGQLMATIDAMGNKVDQAMISSQQRQFVNQPASKQIQDARQLGLYPEDALVAHLNYEQVDPVYRQLYQVIDNNARSGRFEGSDQNGEYWVGGSDVVNLIMGMENTTTGQSSKRLGVEVNLLWQLSQKFGVFLDFEIGDLAKDFPVLTFNAERTVALYKSIEWIQANQVGKKMDSVQNNIFLKWSMVKMTPEGVDIIAIDKEAADAIKEHRLVLSTHERFNKENLSDAVYELDYNLRILYRALVEQRSTQWQIDIASLQWLSDLINKLNDEELGDLVSQQGSPIETKTLIDKMRQQYADKIQFNGFDRFDSALDQAMASSKDDGTYIFAKGQDNKKVYLFLQASQEADGTVKYNILDYTSIGKSKGVGYVHLRFMPSLENLPTSTGSYDLEVVDMRLPSLALMGPAFNSFVQQFKAKVLKGLKLRLVTKNPAIYEYLTDRKATMGDAGYAYPLEENDQAMIASDPYERVVNDIKKVGISSEKLGEYLRIEKNGAQKDFKLLTLGEWVFLNRSFSKLKKEQGLDVADNYWRAISDIFERIEQEEVAQKIWERLQELIESGLITKVDVERFIDEGHVYSPLNDDLKMTMIINAIEATDIEKVNNKSWNNPFNDKEKRAFRQMSLERVLNRFPTDSNKVLSDQAQLAQKGGIDLTPEKMKLETKTDSRLPANDKGIQFNIDPAQLQALEAVPGLSPVIISILPVGNLYTFLGIVN